MKELKAHKINRKIALLYEELHKHQVKCKHLKVSKTYKGDTGNYDPSQDCYWIDYKCPTCLKIWREAQ